MRDIRSALQDRANLIEKQISAEQAQFEKVVGAAVGGVFGAVVAGPIGAAAGAAAEAATAPAFVR
jgi:outer membrane lipoprotein SlyB